MKHRPTRLALLISLIGVGVAPCAYARSEARVLGTSEVALGNALDEVAATLLESSDPYPDFEWAPERAAVPLSVAPGALALYSAGSDDWAPGESPVAAEPVDPQLSAGAQTPVDAKRKQTGKSHRVRVRLQGPSIKARLAEIFSADDASAIDRRAQPTVVMPAAEPAPVIEATAQTAAVAGLGDVSSAPTDTLQPSAHADRLLEDLSALVHEGPTAATEPEQASSEPSPEPVAAVTEVLPERREASMPRIEPTDIVVAPESSKVLRSLEAILFDERDEVGAIRRDPVETIVSTQSDKVMAMLGEVTAAQQEPVEDGAAKRARKRAALAAKAAAKAAQQETQQEAQQDERQAAPQALAEAPPTLTPVAAAISSEAPRAEPQPRISPFGDQRVAVSESSLDRVRGGFGGDGLNISFGIERAVYINGSLVTTTSLNVSSLGQVVAGRGATTFDAGTIALIQSGLGNSVSTGSISSASMGTVIQNTLDGQKIQNITVINATANSLGLMRSMNLGSSLRGAVIDSLRR